MMTMMVMKRAPSPPPLRVSVAVAKAQLSRLLRSVGHQTIVIHNRGRDVARLIGPGGTDVTSAEDRPFVAFLRRLERLRRRVGLDGVDFDPPRAVFRPQSPFEDEV
jgi:antitoxin (DNA-binding transcriptional repressor) of toxin-antitoxin stability system